MVSIGNLVGGPFYMGLWAVRNGPGGPFLTVDQSAWNTCIPTDYIIAPTLTYFLGFLRPFHLKNDTRRQNLRTFQLEKSLK